MHHSEMQHSEMQHSEMQSVCVWPQMEGWAKGKKRGSEQSRALLHLCHMLSQTHTGPNFSSSENFIIGFALLRNGDILGTESIIDPLVSNDWKKIRL